jgi:hypothetical protein
VNTRPAIYEGSEIPALMRILFAIMGLEDAPEIAGVYKVEVRKRKWEIKMWKPYF